MNHSIKIYNLLLEKNFTKQQAEEFVIELDQTVNCRYKNQKEIFATKSDIDKVIFWMVGLVLGQMGLIFLILN
jgi:hypothetical protein